MLKISQSFMEFHNELSFIFLETFEFFFFFTGHVYGMQKFLGRSQTCATAVIMLDPSPARLPGNSEKFFKNKKC